MTQRELLAAGFDVSNAAHARLSRFVELLLEENECVNLTAVRDEAEVWRGHICDSLMLLPVVRAHAVTRLLDLGTGGGLPGLPLACVSTRVDVTLVDATRKKVAAVRRIISTLALENARAVWGRSELLAHIASFREQYDAITARAVATLPVIIEYAAGFVRPGGHCWFFKSAEGERVESGARGLGGAGVPDGVRGFTPLPSARRTHGARAHALQEIGAAQSGTAAPSGAGDETTAVGCSHA